MPGRRRAPEARPPATQAEGDEAIKKASSSKALAWALFWMIVVLAAAGEALWILNLSPRAGSDQEGNWGRVVGEVAPFVFAIVGVLLGTRRPGHAVAWICLGSGFFMALHSFAGGYAQYSLVSNPGALPAAEVLAWIDQWSWVVWAGLITIPFFLLFPDGHLPSPRWRPLVWVSVAAVVAMVCHKAFSPGRFETDFDVVNPVGIDAAEGFLDALAIGGLLLPVCMLASATSLVLRFRRAVGEERLQLKWFASAAIFGSLTYLAFTVIGARRDASIITSAPLPIAVGIAILRYRLYGIDLVVNKAIVVAALAAFVTAAYVAVVVGLGSAIGGVEDDPSIALSILATALVAIAFQPVQLRAQRFANRLVYGERATPYEVLAEFSARVAETYATDDVLPKMARTIAEGTGARRAEVWLRAGRELRLAASWPGTAGDSNRRLALSNGQLPSFPSAERAVPVRHQEQLLGALTVEKPPGEPLTPTEEKLLTDLASQAGLVLRNVGLNSELHAHLEELAASRQRLVAAEDAARRRLERNLHDGAQQHLVALKVRLNLATRMVEKQPQLKEALESLLANTDDAIEALRDLARGIYPPLLAEKGLAVALNSHVKKTAMKVEIHAEKLSRYPQNVEAAVYFCCLEALQNVAKYAGDTDVVVTISDEDGRLRFSVEDNGKGFDPASQARGAGLQNMADRVAALGGTLHVTSKPGKGTTIAGDLPTGSAHTEEA